MGGSPAFARENLPPSAAALYVQIREAHALGGWDNGWPIVAARDHGCDADRRAACALQPPALHWMPAVCDRMDDAFSRTFGAWPAAFSSSAAKAAAAPLRNFCSAPARELPRLILSRRSTPCGTACEAVQPPGTQRWGPLQSRTRCQPNAGPSQRRSPPPIERGPPPSKLGRAAAQSCMENYTRKTGCS